MAMLMATPGHSDSPSLPKEYAILFTEEQIKKPRNRRRNRGNGYFNN